MSFAAPARHVVPLATLAVCVALCPSKASLAQHVSVSSVTVTDCGQKETTSVSVDDATGAFAFDFRVSFDCGILAAEPPAGGDCTAAGADVRLGSFVSDCALCGASLNDGTMTVGIGCTQPRTGGGTLLNIEFTPWANGTSALTLSQCAVDESPCASTTDGSVQVNCADHGATLSGSVTPQGRPDAPHPTWSAPVRVSLAAAAGSGAPLRCSRTTDDSGAFDFTGLAPGDYRACARRSHTLQSCVDLTLTPGPNPVDFGVLREGDATGDNCVLLLDFSRLAASFGSCTGQAGFDAQTDFDDDGCVQAVDFSLLATNFARCGAVLVPTVP